MTKKLISALLLGASATTAMAEAPISIGVRLGLNASNISETRLMEGSKGIINPNWKCGFNVGAVVDIPMGQNFFVQPGFYFNHRNDGYTTSVAYRKEVGGVPTIGAMYTDGHVSTNWFHIPVLISYRYAPVSIFELQVDFGPYLSYGIGGHDTYTTIELTDGLPAMTYPEIRKPSFGKSDGQYFRLDWGFKMGLGFEFFDHYYFGAHYLIGARNIAKNKEMLSDAQSHEWQFTLGYNF